MEAAAEGNLISELRRRALAGSEEALEALLCNERSEELRRIIAMWNDAIKSPALGKSERKEQPIRQPEPKP